MDTITQGFLGACAAQGVLRRRIDLPLTLAGAIGAMAPDADIFIRSASDPLLSLEYHRHFTHSLFFIPFGGLLVTLLLVWFYRKKYSFGLLYLVVTVGYGTHALLDACTAYGTVLLWPFSNNRFAWNYIAVLDPVVSLVLFLGLVLSLYFRRALPALLGLILTFSYIGFGYVQHERVEKFQQKIASHRGHSIERSFIQPAVLNLIVWRSVYQSGDHYYVDGFRVLPNGHARYWEGGSLPVFDKKFENPPIPEGSRLGRDLERYEWFSDGYLAPFADGPKVIGDIRYSTYANGLKPIWGIRFDSKTPHLPVQKARFGFRPIPA